MQIASTNDDEYLYQNLWRAALAWQFGAMAQRVDRAAAGQYALNQG
jgi:hypothetical protein